MLRSLRHGLTGLAVATALSACSSSNGVTIPPSIAPSSAPLGGPTVPLTIAIAAPFSQSVNGVNVTVANGTTSASTTQPCSANGCSISVPALTGRQTFTIALTASGTTVSTGDIIANATELQEAPPTVVFNGTPATYALSLEPGELIATRTSTNLLRLLAFDASGRRIIGSTPYTTPVTLTSSDTTGSTTLSTTTVSSPSQTVQLTYNGASALTTFSITAGNGAATTNVVVEAPPGTSTNGKFRGDLTLDSKEVLAAIPTAPPVPTILPRWIGHRTLAATSIDNSVYFPPVSDQGNSNNCAVMSGVYGIRTYLEKVVNLNGSYNLLGNGPFGNNTDTTFSPTFTYNQVNRGIDDGTSLVAVADSLKQVGAVPWTTVPWTPSQPAVNFLTPSNVALAGNYKISAYYTIDPNDTTKLKTYLASGYPIYMAFDVDGAFSNVTSYWNGIYDGSKPGGHAMVLVGYDDNYNAGTSGTGAFKLLNSWGSGWGVGGYTYIPYTSWANARDRETLVLVR